MPIRTLNQVELKKKRVFIRVDFNVPQNEKGEITDDTRIRAFPSKHPICREAGAKTVLASHLGRPKGKKDPKYSLSPVAERLSQHLGKKVGLAGDCIGEEVQSQINQMKEGEVLLLENLRFHAEEEKNDEAFSKALASLCDVYVNDAFGAAHRAHASTEGMTRYVKIVAAGFLMMKEIESLEKALVHPQKPYVAIMGGAKVSDKIGVIQNLLDKVTTLLIGGGMAYTFLKAQGIEIGKSLLEEDHLEFARDALASAKGKIKFLLPSDHVAAETMDVQAKNKIVKNGEIPAAMGLPGYRAGDDEGFFRRDQGCKNHCLEWPYGCV